MDQLLVSVSKRIRMVRIHTLCTSNVTYLCHCIIPSILLAPGDYDSGPYTVTFTAGQDSASVIVMMQTVDDSTLELTEYFKVMITTDRPGKVQPGDPDTSYITILDNEPGE